MNDLLKEKLEKIEHVFDIQKLLSINADNSYIRGYYLKNKIPYTLFHTKQNFVHMGISRDESFKESDLLEHAKFVDRYISEQNAQNVLELATGRGANSFWLAKENPNSNFFGIDLSEGQLSFALKATKKCSNFQAEIGDFHNLKQFKDNSFDIIFIVEALCHSNSTEKVLGEVQRILKDGGHFIVFDGYLGNKQLSNDEKVAAKITEHGMAVVEFLKYQDLKRMALNAGLAVIEEENLSQFVIPTMRRFERLAESFFKRPLIGRCVAWLFPQEFVYNSVSGMLMSVLFQERVFEYWVTVFKNKKAYPSE